MDVEIEIYIGSSSIDGDISRHLLNLRSRGINVPQELINNPLEEGEKLLKREFLSVFTQLRSLLPYLATVQKVRIQVQDDLGQERPKILGAYDIYATKETGVVTFSVSAHLLLDLLMEEFELGDYIDTIPFKALWCHELVHLEDRRRIEMEMEQRESNIREYLSARKQRAFDIIEECQLDAYCPREWYFLDAISKYRSEGLAELLPILCGFSEPRTQINGRDEAITLFRALWGPFKEILHRPRQMRISDLELSPIFDLIEKFKNMSYVLGPWLVAEAIANMGLQGNEQIEKCFGILSGKKEIKPFTLKDAVEFIKDVLERDLGTFLRYLTEKSINEPTTNYYLTMEELMEIAHFISLEDAKAGEYPNFISFVVESALNKKPELFVEILEEVLGTPMEESEIEEEWKEFEGNLMQNELIPDEFKEDVKTLKKLWDEDRTNEILIWTLTYLLDPQDLVRDNMPYLGYLDDYYVIKAGLMLSRVLKDG